MIRKILVVDDSELLHRMYDLILMRYRNSGTTVLHARDGSQAITLIRDHLDVDLILLDINMPVMSGLHVLSGLRAMGRLPFITVIMVSTEGHEKDVEHALASGATAYVTKPFTPAHLHSLIDGQFGEHAAAGTGAR